MVYVAGPLVCPAFLSVPGRAVSGGSDGLWVKVADCVAPQLKPCVCPGPMAGQVQDGSSLGAGQAGGNVDDLAAQGGAARDGVLLIGECGGRAQQVVGAKGGEHASRTICAATPMARAAANSPQQASASGRNIIIVWCKPQWCTIFRTDLT